MSLTTVACAENCGAKRWCPSTAIAIVTEIDGYLPLILEKLMDYNKLIRQIRSSPLLFDSEDSHKIHRILRKAIKMRRNERELISESRGFYSGMTKRELAATGTCEPDWF